MKRAGWPKRPGKTTAILMLLGLIRPNAGKVGLFGEPLLANRHSLMQRVGAVSETPLLIIAIHTWIGSINYFFSGTDESLVKLD